MSSRNREQRKKGGKCQNFPELEDTSKEKIPEALEKDHRQNIKNWNWYKIYTLKTIEH